MSSEPAHDKPSSDVGRDVATAAIAGVTMTRGTRLGWIFTGCLRAALWLFGLVMRGKKKRERR